MPLALKGQLTVGACIVAADQLVRLIDLRTHDGVPVLDAVVQVAMTDAGGAVVQASTPMPHYDGYGYIAQLEDDRPLVAGRLYVVVVTAVGGGYTTTWRTTCVARPQAP